MAFVTVVLWFIITYLFSQYDCSSPKPRYINYDDKFTKLAVASNYVLIGGENNLFYLNSSLEPFSQTNSGEVWLLTVYNETIIVCNINKDVKDKKSKCKILQVLDSLPQVVDQYSFTIENLSTVFITTTFAMSETHNVLMIASSSCLNIDTNEDCRAISSFSFVPKLLPLEDVTRTVNYKIGMSVDFKAIFQKATHIYFLYNSEQRKSLLGKMCTKMKAPARFNSYEDTPIQCYHNTKLYTIALDAVHWKDFLFVAFKDDSSSVICRYEFSDIAKKYKQSRQERLKCPYTEPNTDFFKQGTGVCLFNRTCQSQITQKEVNCSEVTDHNGFCNTQLFGSVEGSLPIDKGKVIFMNKNEQKDVISKLGIASFEHHGVIYVGTSTGKIGKMFFNRTHSKALGTFKTVQNSFPVLDIKALHNDVYVMTENKVVNVADKEPCPNTTSCEICMTSNNSACGWDIVSESCIKNPDGTEWWLPSIGRQCLQINTEEHQISENTTAIKSQELKIHFKFEPDISLHYVYCWNNKTKQKTDADESPNYFGCFQPVRDEDFELSVGLKENGLSTGPIIASTIVQFYKCSSLNSCKKCVSRHCKWCLQTQRCVTSTTICNAVINQSEEQQCPVVNSSYSNLRIHKNQKQDVKIYVDNIDPYNDKGKLRCIIDEKKFSVKRIETGTLSYVECKNVMIQPSKQGNLHVPIFLEYDASRLDGNSSLEVYDCRDFGDESCGYCKYKKTQGYKCDWCGSCKYTEQDDCGGPGNSKKCSISISKLDPSSGPNFGGTLVTLEGKNVGNQDDDITVMISGAECTNVTVVKPSKKISCITGNATGSSSIHVYVNVNGERYTAANIKYTYVGQHVIHGFSPNRSIIAGGKKIHISGNNLIFPGSDYEIYFCYDSNSCLQCRLSKKNVKDQYMICRMERSSSILTLKYLKIIIDKNTVVRKNGTFIMVDNPKLDLNAEIPPVFKSGGSKITIRGSGFSNVGEVAIEGVEKLCTIKSNVSVECDAPPYVESDFNRKKRATGQNANIHFDGYLASYPVFYAENPEFDKLTNVIEYEDGEEGAPITIMGRNLLEGALQSDYTVKIGLDGTCLIQQISNWNITCLPPKSKPRTNHSDETIVFVVVEVGNIQDNLGNIRYITALPILPIVIGVLGTALLVSVAVVITVVLASKRKRKGAEKKFQMELLVLEDKIRETSREEFADAQMTIRDIKSDLVTSRVPYCNYQSYAFHQLFPNQDSSSHSLLFEPMVTDDNRRKVQKAMDMFDKLMTNKLFMKSLVQTLESQNKLTPQDKAQFASLLSVCLLGNMKLFYQLIDSLLMGMIKAANKKQHKVLFRRFDTITQRLTVNWLALSLFDHLKKNGGMQLFMLYKATQTVIEKAPIDAITILCKNTLAEERLLKNRVEHEILTLDIDLNGNSDQRIPVIVLDCDTITQVKQKCCTAIYKNQPASEIPTPDELELEWHAGKSGKLTLQDIDNISDRSNGMIRLNTLKHYMVKNGSVMALMYKESSDPDDIYVNQGGTIAADDIEDMENQHVQGMVPTSTDHVKLLMPETAADNQDLKWHLSNLPDEEKSNKEHEIGEIFLNRLFHTKLILRDYIEACFEGITDSQSLSIPVRYFLCMIDKQGKEVGVDGDILQSWKSECYATRVWASLIAKPQILFDVNVPSHVEPCMDILKQVFIDSFTQCPQHVTKDASTQKLLFCKDIPEYRKNVNSFFIKVEAVNDQEFWKAMDEISSEQTKEMKFSRQATLHQLYKFIAKYKDEIIEDFQEKDETKDLAFGNKLEEVIDLMEEP